MNASLRSRMSLVAACLAVGLAGQVMGAVALSPSSPTYTVPFNGPADIADFQPVLATDPAATDTWTVSGGVWQHNLISVWGNSIGSAQAVQITGVAGRNFTVSVDLTLTDRNTSQTGWGISLPILANGTSYGIWSGEQWYSASLYMGVGGGDSLSLTSSDIDWSNYAPTTLASQSLSSLATTGVPYHLTVTGTYDASGNLVLGATVTDGDTQLASITTSPLASPKAGNYFAISESLGWGSSGSVNYDNYQVSIPEPATLGLLGLVSVSVLARRRRPA